MKEQNIITDVSKMTKDELIGVALNLDTGCTANVNFTFTGTTFSLFQSRRSNYVTLNSAGIVSGDHMKIQAADDAHDLLVLFYGIVAEQVNVQAVHNLLKLKSSGGILTEEGDALGVLPKAVIEGSESKVSEEILITITTYEKAIGTMVYWKDLTAGTPMESDFFAQKRFIHLDGLIKDHHYEIWVAHKGSVRKVILSESTKCWCN